MSDDDSDIDSSSSSSTSPSIPRTSRTASPGPFQNDATGNDPMVTDEGDQPRLSSPSSSSSLTNPQKPEEEGEVTDQKTADEGRGVVYVKNTACREVQREYEHLNGWYQRMTSVCKVDLHGAALSFTKFIQHYLDILNRDRGGLVKFSIEEFQSDQPMEVLINGLGPATTYHQAQRIFTGLQNLAIINVAGPTNEARIALNRDFEALRKKVGQNLVDKEHQQVYDAIRAALNQATSTLALARDGLQSAFERLQDDCSTSDAMHNEYQALTDPGKRVDYIRAMIKKSLGQKQGDMIIDQIYKAQWDRIRKLLARDLVLGMEQEIDIIRKVYESLDVLLQEVDRMGEEVEAEL